MGLPLCTQLLRCKVYDIRETLPFLDGLDANRYEIAGYHLLPENGGITWDFDGLISSMTEDPFDFQDYSVLIQTINLGLFELFGPPLPYKKEDDRKLDDASLRQKILEWCHKYGFPSGRSILNTMHRSLSLAYASEEDDPNLNGEDECYFCMPLFTLVIELLDIEIMARALLNHETDLYQYMPKLFNPSVTYNLRTEMQDLRPTIIAANMMSGLQIQILHLSQYMQADPIKFCKCCSKAFRPSHGKQDYCMDPCNKDMASKRRTRARSKGSAFP